ncbi:MAG: class I SAM-dependent methyltransferase [Acidimicrobiales bacterium]|jgi:SAM-dependent methyltransferase|nr:class I SAM-dependent methyltransferase [Acidimicrobiales bacterium]
MARWLSEGGARGDEYDERWKQMEAAGQNPHGEADFVCRYAPTRVLDAGCGTGRIGIELARRGIDVVGVDIDPAMLGTAETKAPHIRWIHADLSVVDLGPDPFDVAVLAGNVMIFVAPGTERAVVDRCAGSLRPGGRLIAGFQLQPGRYDLVAYDADAAAAGLVLDERYATWDGEPFVPGGGYAVSVHRRPADGG